MATVMPMTDVETIKRRLYRTDLSAKGQILPEYKAQLSEADLAQYRDQGYLALEGLFTAEEVESFKAGVADVIHGVTEKDKKLYIQEEPYYKTGGGDDRAEADYELRVRKVFWFVQIEPRLAAAGNSPKVITLVDQLIGANHRMIQDMALLKPPFHGSEKPWHQDTAYFDWTPLGGIMGIWIALDEATVENGCMQVIPGSHLAGPTPHFHERDCQIADERVGVNQAVVIPLKPGGALFFSGLIHHGTPPNMSGDRRRALQFHYAAENCRSLTFAEHAELFNEGGAYAGCRKIDPASGLSQAVHTA